MLQFPIWGHGRLTAKPLVSQLPQTLRCCLCHDFRSYIHLPFFRSAGRRRKPPLQVTVLWDRDTWTHGNPRPSQIPHGDSSWPRLLRCSFFTSSRKPKRTRDRRNDYVLTLLRSFGHGSESYTSGISYTILRQPAISHEPPYIFPSPVMHRQDCRSGHLRQSGDTKRPLVRFIAGSTPGRF